ncbi:geranylgeranylglycerol-phosphate geranylgeranyltransferase [Rhabdobacter roseus]|uniref:4-hydroxybenzoate polyprenyltransferase n=1 Tax=Rhabdobacter roseus TaxID=1655419 RepID=A0A840TL87_9BACT|nr:geranylgeranylglycerol-phosphate geranylgeranyltransferase [Rhabdobacter roseus]MBB5284184.1 4-hydroxybenzoate polyprenyltransferase [Rhabdobacter roseus]
MSVSARRRLTSRDYFLGFFRLIRVRNLFILVLTQYLTRIFLIGPREDWPAIIRDPALALLALSTALIAAAGYIINDYFDVKIDIVNKPERVVVGRYLKRRVAMGAHQVLNVLGVLIGLLVSRWVFLVNVLSVTMLWFYSAQFKRLPLIGNLVVSLLTGLSLVVLTVHYPANRHLVLIYATFSFFISLIREVIKDMEDVRGDEAHGCRTLPIVWGLRRTKLFLYSLIAVFIPSLFLMAYSLQNPLLGWLFFALLVPIGWMVYRLVKADTRRDFAQLSSWCKLIMLLGLTTMLWA